MAWWAACRWSLNSYAALVGGSWAHLHGGADGVRFPRDRVVRSCVLVLEGGDHASPWVTGGAVTGGKAALVRLVACWRELELRLLEVRVRWTIRLNYPLTEAFMGMVMKREHLVPPVASVEVGFAWDRVLRVGPRLFLPTSLSSCFHNLINNYERKA